MKSGSDAVGFSVVLQDCLGPTTVNNYESAHYSWGKMVDAWNVDARKMLLGMVENSIAGLERLGEF